MKFELLKLFVLLMALPLLSSCQQGNKSFEANNSDGRVESAIIGGGAVALSSAYDPTVRIVTGTEGCSGAYIGNARVLTAAHCQSVAGKTRVTFTHLGWGNETCSVTKVSILPEYTQMAVQTKSACGNSSAPAMGPLDDDIAVLSIKCGSMNLAEVAGYNLASGPAPQSVTGAGYGLVSESDNGRSTKLKSIRLTQFDMSLSLDYPEIKEDAGKLAARKHTVESQKAGSIICYGASKSATLYLGDSGGPSFSVDANGSRTIYGVQSGIISHNSSCHSTGVSGLYAVCQPAVSHFRTWILAQ